MLPHRLSFWDRTWGKLSKSVWSGLLLALLLTLLLTSAAAQEEGSTRVSYGHGQESESGQNILFVERERRGGTGLLISTFIGNEDGDGGEVTMAERVASNNRKLTYVPQTRHPIIWSTSS